MTPFVLALGAFLAGLLKVGFGQGSGILPLPLYTLVVSARHANGVLAPLLIVGDLLSIRAYWRQWETRLLLLLIPGQMLGVAAGAYALAHISDLAARRSIGALLLALVGLQLWAQRASGSESAPSAIEAHPLGTALVSLLSGFTSALAQLGAAFLAVYLVRLRTTKQAMVPTLNITFFFSNIVKVGFYWHYGLINTATWITDAWLAPAVVMGGVAGVAVNRRLGQRAFEKLVLGFALLAGAKLLLLA